jgi:hypothetical protein
MVHHFNLSLVNAFILLEESGVGGWEGVCGRRQRVQENEGVDK